MRHVLTLPVMPGAVRMVRETAELTFAEWGIDPSHPTLGPALLILSELATNSIRHAAVTSPSITVIFAAGEYTLAFAVHDRHPYHPGVFAAAAGGTGGLAMIAEVMVQSGGTCVVRRDADGGGKSVWITLPL